MIIRFRRSGSRWLGATCPPHGPATSPPRPASAPSAKEPARARPGHHRPSGRGWPPRRRRRQRRRGKGRRDDGGNLAGPGRHSPAAVTFLVPAVQVTRKRRGIQVRLGPGATVKASTSEWRRSNAQCWLPCPHEDQLTVTVTRPPRALATPSQDRLTVTSGAYAGPGFSGSLPGACRHRWQVVHHRDCHPIIGVTILKFRVES
jgi:hypothetical protein